MAQEAKGLWMRFSREVRISHGLGHSLRSQDYIHIPCQQLQGLKQKRTFQHGKINSKKKCNNDLTTSILKSTYGELKAMITKGKEYVGLIFIRPI